MPESLTVGLASDPGSWLHREVGTGCKMGELDPQNLRQPRLASHSDCILGFGVSLLGMFRQFTFSEVIGMAGFLCLLFSDCSLYSLLFSVFYFLLEYHVCVCLVTQSCLTLCDPMDCNPPGSSVHGIFFRQEYWSGWVAISSSRRSFQPKHQTHVSYVLHCR